MARMWPRHIPSWVEIDKRRSAEIKVFKKLEECLDESWSVFYSRPWYGISATGGEIEGEADFVIANADKGIFFLEVKGGQISYDPAKSQWSSTDRNKITHKIKDPIEQAKKCRFQFAKQLERQKDWPSGYINFKYGAVLPDTLVPDKSINTIGGHDKSLFCHAGDFENNFENWISNRLNGENFDQMSIGPGRRGVEIIESLIAQPVTLKSSVGMKVHEDLHSMDQLFTGAQLQIILTLQSLERAVVSGGAGTGKTLLAIEMASNYSKIGLRTLVITCSAPLANYIRLKLAQFKNITVCTIEELKPSKYFEESWDFIAVDEAQDVPWDNWRYIESLIKPSGKLLVFMDSNQSIYRPSADLVTLLAARNFELNINLRNTRLIAKSTEPLYTGPLVHAPGPVGDFPEVINVATFNDAIEKCYELISNLAIKDALQKNEIVILCRDKRTREKIQYELSTRKILSKNAVDFSFDVIRVETVPLFKGLEAPVVIAICDAELANNSEMAYVAISRARSRFYLIGNVNGTLMQKALTRQEATF